MRILITGGAGLVGSHCAEFFAGSNSKNKVIVLDNLMRSQIFGYQKDSVEFNWKYLKKFKNIVRIKGDVRNDLDVKKAIGCGVDVVIHTAGQPGVPSSVRMPIEDFSINAFGTINVLEAARKKSKDTVIIYCSTNKVYGENVDNIPLVEQDKRFAFRGTTGVSESMLTDLTGHTPYGVSKLVGDLYVQEYSHIYKMKTAVFRMSCVSADTEVATAEGVTSIQGLENRNTGVQCFLKRIETMPTKGSFKTDSRGKTLYKIKTKRGYELKATGDHPFYTPGGYKNLDEIDYGSFLATAPEFIFMRRKHSDKLPNKTIISANAFTMQLKKYGRTDKSNLSYVEGLQKNGLLPLLYKNPHIYTIAGLVGYLTGDGHLYFRKKPNGKSYTEIQVYGLPQELDSIKESFRKLGCIPGVTRSSRSTSVLSNGRIIKGVSYRFSITQTGAFTLFELLGVPVGNKTQVKFQVPKWVLQAPKDVQDEYLAGLFGAEMSAPGFKRRNDDGTIDLQPPHFTQSKDEKLHRNLNLFRGQIVAMLKKRGIKSRVYTKRADFFSKKDGHSSICYDLVINSSKENIMNLARIGYVFNDERKKEILKIAEFLKTGLPYSHYDAWNRENTYLLEDKGLLWDMVVEKRAVPMERIYDITVPGHHNFFANGFLVHNCTYGTRQFGFEDQGWVAWFVIAALFNKAVTIYGNGKQVRDMLYVDDLVGAFNLFINSDLERGLFNIGGGPRNTISLLEFMDELKELTGKELRVNFSDWRPSDQKVYITDTTKIEKTLGWKADTTVRDGIAKLTEWIKDNKSFFV